MHLITVGEKMAIMTCRACMKARNAFASPAKRTHVAL